MSIWGSKRKGFTFAELMIVLSIISVIILASLNAVNGQLSRARDSRRMSDIQQFRTALEMYRMDHLATGYPQDDDWLPPTYIASIPLDPLTHMRDYWYYPVCTAGPCTSYKICAHLESRQNTPDPICQNPPNSVDDCWGTTGKCNYGVVNP